jgi:uncharacterized protein involved in response to NO
VLGGFLLTASKNWVKVRGLHGGALLVAVLLWLVERVAVLYAFALVPWLRWLLLNAFLLFVAGYVAWTLVRYRKQDSFSDNAYFLVALPAFLVAKNLLLHPDTWTLGWMFTIGLFRVAFVVMFERTFPPFMKAAAKLDLVRIRPLDTAIKALVLVAAFEGFLPVPVAAVVLFAAASLLLTRLVLWKPLVGLSMFNVAVMYVGALFLAAHLALEALRLTGWFVGIGSVATHTFAFGVLGVIVPPMLVRISQGHTGRPLLFTGSDRAAVGLLGVGGFFRVLAPQFWPAHYLTFIALAGVGWAACFALVGARLIPFLWKPRVDGKEH